jgi:hypothetical protein
MTLSLDTALLTAGWDIPSDWGSRDILLLHNRIKYG